MSNFYLSDVFEDVSEEGQRAREKFGEQSDSTDERWLAILMEEVGEAATEVLRAGNPGLDHLLKRSNETGIPLDAEDIEPRLRLRKEIVQVAAVAMRWVQSLDTRMERERMAKVIRAPIDTGPIRGGFISDTCGARYQGTWYECARPLGHSGNHADADNLPSVSHRGLDRT